jgi:putative hydrolase of the HAD superfamily
MTATSSSFLPPQRQLRPREVGAGVRAVCLDVDDTLVDYSGASRAALRRMVGHDRAWRLWEQVTDENVARVIAGECDGDAVRWQRTQEFFACLGEAVSDAEARRREDDRSAAMRAAWALFDDVAPCLEWLAAVGVRIAVVTNASGGHQRVKLANLGVAGFVDEVVIAGELGVAKPDPVIFHTACDRLGCAPDEVVHVGDRLDLDAIGARDAGLAGVWLNRTGPVEGTLPAGVSMITSLDTLPELLVCELDLAVYR